MNNRMEELKKAFIVEVEAFIKNITYYDCFVNYDFDCFFEENNCTEKEIAELISTLNNERPVFILRSVKNEGNN